MAVVVPSFKLDIYKDFTNEQLKTRCLELSRTASKYGLIIAMMSEAEEALQILPVEMRETALNLNKAHKYD